MLCYEVNNYSNIKLKETGMQIKAFLNNLCNIPNDDIVNSSFSIMFVGTEGKLKIYLTLNESVKDILVKNFKLMYSDLELKDYEFNDIKSKFTNNCRFQKIGLKYNDVEKRLYSDEPQNVFMENLINSIYSKDEEYNSIMIINLNPISKISNNSNINKKNKKVSKHLLNATKFLLECINYSEEQDKNKKKELEIKKDEINDIQYEYDVSIYVGVSNNNKYDEKELIRKLRLITSMFAQLNKVNMYLPQSTNFNEAFNNDKKYNMRLYSSEIYQFLFLPDEDILSNVLGATDTKMVFDKNVPTEGLFIGKQCDNTIPVCFATPTEIININNYKSIYNKDYLCIKTSKNDNSKRNIKNYNIIDNLSKSTLIMGLQGTGKSEIINSKAINGLKRGIPFILIDPKFDTQKRLIESIPEEYIDNIDFLDLGDLLYPPALNIFRKRKENDSTENSLITTSFLSYMRKQFDRSWGYNIERMLQMTTDAVLLDDTTTMSEFYWMLTEENYRKAIIEVIKSKLDEPECDNKSRLKQLLRYWQDFQARYEKNAATVNKEIETVMNKIGMFIGNRFISAIVSQRKSYDFKASGDMGKSVIVNLPEGIISKDNMNLLAGFVNKAIWADYQSRDDMDMDERLPVQWLIDEAHTIIDDEFVGILQKSRSRRLGLTIITQTLASLDMRGDKISSIVTDNCKTKLIFKIGYGDAKSLVDEFAPLQTSDLTNCPDYHYYGKMLLPDGRVSKPFFANAPSMAPVLRNYDEYKKNHRSGKLKISEIEDDIEDRLDRFRVLNAF